MSRTSSENRSRAAAARPSLSCSIESLEGRQLFSAAPLAGAVDLSPGDAGPGQAGIIAVLRHSQAPSESQSIIGVLRQMSVQSDGQSIIAVLKSVGAVRIIAI